MSISWTEAESREAIRGIIASVADVPLATVPELGAFFEPVGLDSMMVVGIAVEIEEQFGVQLPRTAAGMIALNSIERMAAYVARSLEGVT